MRRPIASPAMSSASRRLLSVAASMAAISLCASAAGSASAATIHVPTQTIAGTGSFALNNPGGIAIDNSGGTSAGSIYVSDTGNHRIIKFDSAGNFLLMWGQNVNEGSGDPDICTNAGSPTDICKVGDGGNGPGWVGQPTNIAVDPSSGPSAGDVYVIADVGNATYVEKFDPTGHLVTSWGGSPFAGALDGSTAPGGPFEYFFGGITVDLGGNLEVFKPNAFPSRLFEFAQDGSSPTSITTVRGSSQGGLSVDPAGNFFKINGDGSTVEKFGPTGSDLGQVNIGTGVGHQHRLRHRRRRSPGPRVRRRQRLPLQWLPTGHPGGRVDVRSGPVRGLRRHRELRL